MRVTLHPPVRLHKGSHKGNITYETIDY